MGPLPRWQAVNLAEHPTLVRHTRHQHCEMACEQRYYGDYCACLCQRCVTTAVCSDPTPDLDPPWFRIITNHMHAHEEKR